MLNGLTVIVAGANGRMGRMFATELEAQGATVLRLGRRDLADGRALSDQAGHLTVNPENAGEPYPASGDAPASAPSGEAAPAAAPDAPRFSPEFLEAAAKADLVLLCVPVALTGPAAARIAALLPIPDSAVWADIASVKARPMHHLAEAVRGPVVGTHPLFGPSSPPGAPERRCAVIPGARAQERDAALLERVFTALGCTVFRGTAEDHDRAVAIFQSLNFLTSAAFLSLAAKNPGIAPYMTPSFRRRLASSRVLMLEDGELFAGLTFQNDAVPGMLDSFRACLEGLLRDPESAARELEFARSWWK